MKLFYLTGSVILTVLILILSFGNIQAQCSSLMFFFYSVDQSPTIIILVVAVLGVITGVFYHGALSTIMATPEDEEEQKF
ncbi:MAG: hypothetical protein AAB848_02265 [Patescibacteria group bacterium]